MIAVTGYPVGYAIWLSLERYNMELPQNIKFVGLSNYGAILTSPYWWQALKVTVIITIFSVGITLVLGMLLAMVMFRTLFGRGTVRTASPACGWPGARPPPRASPAAAYNTRAPLAWEVKPMGVIILAEIWKTT